MIRGDRGSLLVATPDDVVHARVSARLMKSAGPAELPAVGDWVAVRVSDGVDAPQIEAVLERASAITRSDPGRTSDIQVLVANIDIVFVVHPHRRAAQPAPHRTRAVGRVGFGSHSRGGADEGRPLRRR